MLEKLKNLVKPKRTKLDEEIEYLLEQLGRADDIESDWYQSRLDALERLMKIKGEKPKRVSRDTIVTVGGSIVTVLIIVFAEETRVLTSKALGFVLKGRV